MSLLGIILIVLVLMMLVGSNPRWPYSRDWGYRPNEVLLVVLVIVIALVATGRI